MHRTPKRRSPMPRPTLRTRRRPDSTVKLHVEALEDRALLSAWHFDFGTPTSPAAAGYTAVPVVLYDANVGYGWQSVTGITDFNGTSVGAGWVTSSWDWAGGGALSASVNGGILTLAGGQMRSSQTLSNASVDGRVSFAGAPWQQFGMATNIGDASGNYWALF